MDLNGLMDRRRLLRGGVVALLILFFAAACYYRLRVTPPHPPALPWYYDLGTGSLFTARSTEPPIRAPSGKDGVIAHVFACGDCARAADRVVTYLETDTAQFKEAQAQTVKAGVLVNPRRGDPAFMFGGTSEGRLIARPAMAPQWVSLSSEEGQAVLQDTVQCSDGRAALRCTAE